MTEESVVVLIVLFFVGILIWRKRKSNKLPNSSGGTDGRIGDENVKYDEK